jgi:outer membrane receptor protein involved in Fe transport
MPQFSFAPNRLALVIGAVSTLLAGAASAQGAGVLEEVVVVATKREQTLQEVPVAVSVVSAETIEQAQVLDIKDLQTLVPSLRVTQLQTSANTNFVIRGFGNGANNAGIEPSVGVFIDGVYRSRVGSALADLPKLERIEVLRGPQSTLFGKNASAGVINVVTAKPDLAGYSGSVSATLGNWNQSIVRGDITGPLSDSVAFSLYGSYNRRDGYFDNLENGDELNELDRWNLRGQLLWVPTDDLELRLIVDGDGLDEACCGVANLQDGPTGDVVRALGGNLVPNDPYAYENYYDFTPSNDIQTRGASLQVDWDLDGMLLTSITAYRELDQLQNADVDFTSARLAESNASDTQIETFTQELRLTSTGDGPLAWTAGLFYFAEDVSIDSDFRYGDQFRAYADALSGGGVSLVEAILGSFDPSVTPGTFFAAGQGYPVEQAVQDDETWSVFAQGDYAVTDRLTLTLGANYTRSEKEAEVNIVSTDVFSALVLPDAAAALRPLQFLPPFLNFPNSVEDGQSDDDEVTWTARLAFDVSDHVNVYLSAATGFKASSWNLSRDSRPFPADVPALEAAGLLVPNLVPGTRFAEPEESTVYEFGVKAEYPSVAYNLAVFTQEIEGFQSNVFSGTGFNLANAGKQSVDGAEFDITWLPLDSLRLAFAVTYLDPLYDDFVGAAGVDGPTDLSGTRPAGIHEWSTNSSAVYNFALAGARGYLRVEHIYEDEVQNIENVPPEIASREVNMFNASLGLNWSNGIELNLWGRNLNEDEYIQQAFPSVAQAGSFSGYPNQPRTYGVTLRKTF